jgi:regulatory protein
MELFEKRKKEVARLPIEKQKKKLISYLSYRGWETELIYDALREL